MHEPGRVSHLELVVQIFGHQPKAASSYMHFRLCEQSHSGGDDNSALPRRERWNIGPAAGEVESHRRRGPERGMDVSGRRVPHGATHHS
jgi:hypothetical protein